MIILIAQASSKFLEHIFANTHLELTKRCSVFFTLLANEKQLTMSQLNLLWEAGAPGTKFISCIVASIKVLNTILLRP
jgi:hypothetical protein